MRQAVYTLGDAMNPAFIVMLDVNIRRVDEM